MELEETGGVSNIHSPPEEQTEVDEEINIAPNIIDDGMPENPRPQRIRRAPPDYISIFIKPIGTGMN
jgi:hypothetical protein